MSFEKALNFAEVRRQIRARIFTIAIIPGIIREPCRGGIMVEEGILEASRSPAGRHFLSCKFPGIFLIGGQ